MLHCSVVISYMIVSALICIGIHLTENIADFVLCAHKSRSTHLFVKSLQI